MCCKHARAEPRGEFPRRVSGSLERPPRSAPAPRRAFGGHRSVRPERRSTTRRGSAPQRRAGSPTRSRRWRGQRPAARSLEVSALAASRPEEIKRTEKRGGRGRRRRPSGLRQERVRAGGGGKNRQAGRGPPSPKRAIGGRPVLSAPRHVARQGGVGATKTPRAGGIKGPVQAEERLLRGRSGSRCPSKG